MVISMPKTMVEGIMNPEIFVRIDRFFRNWNIGILLSSAFSETTDRSVSGTGDDF
jgi:hypothetical protein